MHQFSKLLKIVDPLFIIVNYDCAPDKPPLNPSTEYDCDNLNTWQLLHTLRPERVRVRMRMTIEDKTLSGEPL
jgi:hypothetical protein